MARSGLDIASAEQRRRIAVDVAARRRIGDRVVAADVAQRATQAPAAAYGAVAADEAPAGRVAHAGRVAVTAELGGQHRAAAATQNQPERAEELGGQAFTHAQVLHSFDGESVIYVTFQ
ncbi:hypothetical protein G6F59_017538 [Rhizopus arrhizus]|nr:hypothetical protein G6F59_017538 [Rhizopus arrhizus]